MGLVMGSLAVYLLGAGRFKNISVQITVHRKIRRGVYILTWREINPALVTSVSRLAEIDMSEAADVSKHKRKQYASDLITLWAIAHEINVKEIVWE